MGQLNWLMETMSAYGDRTAVVWAGRALSYAELIDAARRSSERLDEAGIEGGSVVGIVGDYHPEAIGALLALIDRACIVAPLTEETAPQHAEFLEIAEAQHLIRFASEREWIIEPLGRQVEHRLLTELAAASHPGLIVFSSGSTGRSKAMLHDLTRTLEKFTVRREALVTLTFLLFDHFGGFNTLLHTISNGGTVVAASRRDPDSVCSMIEAHRVELLPVSPTFVNLMLLSEAHQRYDLSSLRLLTYGTEMMPQATLDRARSALPHVDFRQTYGLSETGVLRAKSRDAGSLWLKVGGEGIETKVVDGTLWVRSRWAIVGYLNADDPFDEDGWINTQDRVEVDGDYLRFLGRETDIINVGGNKVYPAEVESALLEHDGVRDAVVFGEPNPLTGQVVVAEVVLADDRSTRDATRQLRGHVAGRLERFKVPARFRFVDATATSARFKKLRPTAAEGPGPALNR